MYGWGLGDAASYLDSISAPAVDSTATTDTSPGAYLSAIASTSPATSGNPLANFLSETGITPPATGTPQTFTQWVEAHSTVLLVAFGAVGALVGLTRVGKR